MGTPAIWLDPAAPGVAERLAATFEELVRGYPALDGLHLDYVRYPDTLPFSPGTQFGVGLGFGFGEATRARFHAETGLVAPFGSVARERRALRRLAARAALARSSRRIAARGARRAPGPARLRRRDPRARARLPRGPPGLARLARRGLARLRGPHALHARRRRSCATASRRRRPREASAQLWVGLGSWLFATRPRARGRAARASRAARADLGDRPLLLGLDPRDARAASSALATRRRPVSAARRRSDLADYDFALPAGARSRRSRSRERDAARLLVLERASGARAHRSVRELPALLAPGRPARRERDARAAGAAARPARRAAARAEALLLGPRRAARRVARARARRARSGSARSSASRAARPRSTPR